MTNLGDIKLGVVADPIGFDKVIKEISKVEAKLKEIGKLDLSKTSGGKEAFDVGLESLTELRSLVGQSAEDIEHANRRISNSFHGVKTQANTISGAFSTLAQRGGLLGKMAGGLGSVFGKAESVLSGFGLTISNVSVLLGAGFAGGLAGLIQVGIKVVEVLARMAQAVARFIIQSALLGSQLTSLRNNIESTFGAAGQEVVEFAKTTALAFGIAETASLEFLQTSGNLFTGFGIGKEDAAVLSVALFDIADGLRQGKTATIPFAKALEDVKAGISGNLEAARELAFVLRESDLKKLVKELGIPIKSPFTSVEQSLLFVIASSRRARELLIEQGNVGITLSEKFEIFRGVLQQIAGEIGTQLAPAFQVVGDVAIGVAVTILRLVTGFNLFTDAVRRFIQDHPILQQALNLMKESLLAIAPVLGLAAKVFGFFSEAGEDARNSARSFEEQLESLNNAERTAIELLREEANVAGLTTEEINSVVDAHKRLERAVRDAAEAEADARLNLSRVREDNAKRAEDARRDLSRAIDEATRSEADARRNLEKVRESSRRSVRDAEEKLTDKQVENAKKVDSAERDLERARRQRNDAILKALISVQEAMFDFDTRSFNRAQRELSEARRKEALDDAQKKRDEEAANTALELSRLQRDLDEARMDAKRDISDAQRQLDRAILDGLEQVEDAQRNIGEVERENARNLFDAKQRLDRVLVSNKEKIDDAALAEQRLLEKFQLTYAEVLKIGDELRTWKELLRSLSGLTSTDLVLANLQGNATGGPVFQGQMGIVGERGPELFIPNQNGQIISNDVVRKLTAALNGGRGGGGSGASIVVHEAADPEATAFAVEARLMRNILN